MAENAHGLLEGCDREDLGLAQPAVFPTQPIEPELIGLHTEFGAIKKI